MSLRSRLFLHSSLVTLIAILIAIASCFWFVNNVNIHRTNVRQTIIAENPTPSMNTLSVPQISYPTSTPSPTAIVAEPTATTQTATPQNPASSRKLVWNEEFNEPKGSPPDPNIWTPDIGGNGWDNKQLEYDTNNLNAYQDGQGNLVLEARKENPQGFQCWYGSCQYTSAHISTNGHFSFTYGYLEARIKIPYGQGLWPAFWLIGSNIATVGWPACGEIDVMENVGKEPSTTYGSVHGPENFTKSYQLQNGALADNFHTFAIQWDPNHVYYFVDGINYTTFDKATLTNQQDWVYDHPFYIILNVAVGGTWPGSPDSTTVFPRKCMFLT